MAPQQLRDKLLASLVRILYCTLEDPLPSATCAAFHGWAPCWGQGYALTKRKLRTPPVDSGPERGQGTADQGAQIFLGRLDVGGAVMFQLGPGLL